MYQRIASVVDCRRRGRVGPGPRFGTMSEHPPHGSGAVPAADQTGSGVLDEAALARIRDRLEPALRLQFADDAVDVAFDGANRHDQLVGDRLVRAS